MTSIETQGEFIDSEDCIPENVKRVKLVSMRRAWTKIFMK
jgi:hypothetical protein